MTNDAIILGAVAYDPKVVTIWEGFRDWFAAKDLDFDFILYSNYEKQVEGHFAGHCNVAWNSPLAWIEAEQLAAKTGRTAKAICMRDTDRDLTSVVVVKADSDIKELADLKGKTVAVGATDSPQATLIPLEVIAQAGVAPGEDFEVQYHNIMVGKHGDHVGGERDAVKSLLAGTADAACMIDGNHLMFSKEGTIASSATRVLHQTTTYDHCNFTVLDGVDDALVTRFAQLLMGQSYDDETVRPLLDMEGLRKWEDGRVSGYDLLNKAVDRFGTITEWLTRQG